MVVDAEDLTIISAAPDFSLAKVRRLLDICEERDEHSAKRKIYPGLKRACEIVEEEFEVTVVDLFKRCFPDKEYRANAAQRLLACVPLLCVKMTGGDDGEASEYYTAYDRPSDVKDFTINIRYLRYFRRLLARNNKR